jgi:hypothetical protein
MAQTNISTPCATIYPDVTVSVLTDSVSALPTGVTIQPGAQTAVAWEIVYQGTTSTGQAAAGGILQTIALLGAVSADDLSSVTIGPALTDNDVSFGPHVLGTS